MSPLPERLSEAGIGELAGRVVAQLGGYLRNTVRETGAACAVCAGPVATSYVECFRCSTDRSRFGDRLADLVVPIAYGIKGGQSGHLMWMYKDPHRPVPRHLTQLTMLLFLTLQLHERCVARAVGRPVDAWAIVPSTTGREGEHPLRVIARRMSFAYPEIGLQVNPRCTADPRSTAPDRFIVDDRERVDGRHVLVIDDTWATGSRAQSAALAAKEAGAAAVTVLVIARWLKPQEHPLSADFQRARLRADFDPFVCPVSGTRC